MQPLYHMYIPGGYFPQPVQALQLPQQPFLFFRRSRRYRQYPPISATSSQSAILIDTVPQSDRR